MRILVTGSSGFVGKHLVAEAQSQGHEVLEFKGRSDGGGDLTEPGVFAAGLNEASPELVFHLAASASVAESWQNPAAAIDGNLRQTSQVLTAVRDAESSPALVLASSGEIYGRPTELPVTEAAPLQPLSPYGVGKAACDLLAGQFAEAHGLRIIRARAFNQIGPGQNERYAVASFTRQLAAGINAGENSVEIVTGNPNSMRDYTDVRCVAKAYLELAESAPPGIYNVCSGEAVSVQELLAALAAATGVTITQRVNPELVRSVEVPEIYGSNSRLTETTGWTPQIPLHQTLTDTVQWWRTQLTAE